MARVLVLVADLMFGSRVQGTLQAGGHQVELIGDAAGLRARLGDACAPAADVLVVDLADAQLDGAQLVRQLAGEGALARVRMLGCYAHVDVQARERAARAGFDLLVPRSRLAREGAALVSRLAHPPEA
jgi:DNA-binding NarL/FixJ family response regulator